MRAQRLKISTEAGQTSGIWQASSGKGNRPALVVAHGAGGDMETPFLEGFAAAVVAAGIGVLRFNFLYKEAGKKPPDSPAKLEAVWRGAFEISAKRAEASSIFVGGKSMGGRIASQVVVAGVPAAGLVFLGYPLHPPGRPERLRDAHLTGIDQPMLFLEGTRDPFATPGPLAATLKRLGKRAQLVEFEGADHSFRVRGTKVDDADIGAALAPFVIDFIQRYA